MRPAEQQSAATKINELIAGLGDWRGERLAEVRQAIREGLQEVAETWKWLGGPGWEQDGIIVVGNAHEENVELTFPQGARLADPGRLFDAGLGGNAWRAIDHHQQDDLDMTGFRGPGTGGCRRQRRQQAMTRLRREPVPRPRVLRASSRH